MAAEQETILRFSEPSAPSTWYYLASTHGRSSGPSDTPANTFIPGTLRGLPQFTMSIFDGVEPQLRPRGGIGVVTIADPTGVLDTYHNKVWDGGKLQVRRGTWGSAYSGFTTMAEFTTAGLLYSHDEKAIVVRDLGWFLDKAPLHDDRYDGGGGAGGDATLTGVIKPYAVGQVFNVPAKLINATNLIYQVSCTPIQSIDAVRAGGDPVTASGTDRANYAAMAGAAPAAGQYDTCIAEGLIRLGSAPTRDITVDLKGDKTSGTYYEKRGDIAKQVATRSGTALTSGQVNSSALTTLNAAQTATCGFFWDQEITKAAALNEVMQGCLGYWYINLSGELVLGYLRAVSGSPDITYTFPQDILGEPKMVAYEVPRFQTILGYQRNYTIQNQNQLAGAVTAANVQLYGQPAQWAKAEAAGQKTYWPGARVFQILSGFWDVTAATTEASQQSSMWEGAPLGAGSRNIERWEVVIKEDPFTLAGYLGRKVAIASYGRYSWASPRTFFLVALTWGGSAQYPTATLWG